MCICLCTGCKFFPRSLSLQVWGFDQVCGSRHGFLPIRQALNPVSGLSVLHNSRGFVTWDGTPYLECQYYSLQGSQLCTTIDAFFLPRCLCNTFRIFESSQLTSSLILSYPTAILFLLQILPRTTFFLLRQGKPKFKIILPQVPEL